MEEMIQLKSALDMKCEFKTSHEIYFQRNGTSNVITHKEKNI
jgi:hypothetical protein